MTSVELVSEAVSSFEEIGEPRDFLAGRSPHNPTQLRADVKESENLFHWRVTLFSGALLGPKLSRQYSSRIRHHL
jgi:hypothetical protein